MKKLNVCVCGLELTICGSFEESWDGFEGKTECIRCSKPGKLKIDIEITEIINEGALISLSSSLGKQIIKAVKTKLQDGRPMCRECFYELLEELGWEWGWEI